MKNVKKMLAVALCSLMMFPALAKTDGPDYPPQKPHTFEVGMYRVKDSLKMRLLLEKEAGEKVMVRLLNAQGQVLHAEVVGKRQQKYGRSFDFSQIKDGRYTLEVANRDEVIKRSINLTTTDLMETPARTLVAVK